MRWIALALVALTLTTNASAQSSPAPLTAVERSAVETMRQVGEAAVDGDLAEAERLARGIIAQRSFRQMRPEFQAMVQRQLAAILIYDGASNCPESLPLIERLARTSANDAQFDSSDWWLFLTAAEVCDDDARLSNALGEIVRRHPERLADRQDDAVLRLAGSSDDAQTLAYFAHGGWIPSDPATDRSHLRLRLTRAYLRAGDIDAARETAQSLVVNGLGDWRSIVILLVEKEFDPITQADPETFNLDAILAWQFHSIETAAAAHPDSLALQIAHIQTLYAANRLDEALAVADAAVARIAASPAGMPAFADQDQQANWLHDRRASVLEAQGSPEEALAAMQAGVETGERGLSNVSQTLNRAADLVRLGRGAEALEAIAAVPSTRQSKYGQMVALRIRTCALAQVGDTAGMRASLREMRARAEDSLLQMRGAAICANDSNLAAQATIRMLRDPEDRYAAVVAMQDFIGGDPVTEYEQAIAARGRAINARRDVRAAIDRVTRIQSFAIRAP